MEQLPNYLFELIGKKAFDALTPQERAAILQHMQEHEYTALHKAALAANALSVAERKISENATHKAALLRQLRNKQKTHLLNTPIALWKAAASVVLFGLAFYFINLRNAIHRFEYITSTDTVYLEKQLPAERILDTVFIKEPENRGMAAHDNNAKQPEPNIQSMPVELPSLNPLNQLTLDDYQQTEKAKRRRNIKDDSLIRSIGFVHL